MAELLIAPRPDSFEEPDTLSLCSLQAGPAVFGIDTRCIREVLGLRPVQRVPLAPAYIGGIVPYRGEILTALSLRALLGLPPLPSESCILVLEDDVPGEHFALMVDSVGGVVTVPRNRLEPNPSTLDARSKAVFDGAFKIPGGLIVQLDTRRLRPAAIEAEAIYRQPGPGDQP